MRRERKVSRVLGLIGLAAAALAVLPTQMLAQRRPVPPDPRNPFPRERTLGEQRANTWFLDVRAGLGMPIGDLTKAASAGPSFGLGVGRAFSKAISLRLRTDVDGLGSNTIESGAVAGQEGPTWLLWHLGAAFSYDVAQGDSPFIFVPELGVGATRFSSSGFLSTEVESWYFAIVPGLSFGYALSPRVSLLLDGHFQGLLGNKEVLNLVVTDLPDAEASVGAVEVQVGLRIHFGGR